MIAYRLRHWKTPWPGQVGNVYLPREKHVCPTYLYIISRHILHFQSVVAHIHVQNVAALEI